MLQEMKGNWVSWMQLLDAVKQIVPDEGFAEPLLLAVGNKAMGDFCILG